ncbi:MAG: pyruvate formate-lyase activating enzyme [Desulfobacterales bacterium]|nr:MAG: pyruvate formate-lyase activating enzyme [Desulfobacterales bacterium]
MSRLLMVDIGAGTMDLLYYDTETDRHYKAVVKSPVRWLAEKAAALPGNLLVTGSEMGGGPITQVLRQRAQAAEVIMSASAAATLHHDPDQVRAWGIAIVADGEADDLRRSANYTPFTLGDVEPDRLQQIVTSFGVPFAFDAVALCAQDHGVPPTGVSHLDFRHQMFCAHLQDQPFPHTLLYRDREVPPSMNRLRAIAAGARMLPTSEIYVMDSGMAAILGASMDVLARGQKRLMILDVATSHTVGAALAGDEIAGFFEYHTQDITLVRLESLLRDLADGHLVHGQILAEGGHGAYLRKAIGFEAAGVIVATGPKRKLVENSQLPMAFGAPWGDNMMTGTVGLLEALRRRKGLEPIRYL